MEKIKKCDKGFNLTIQFPLTKEVESMKIKFFNNKNFTTMYKLNNKYSVKSISDDKSLIKAIIVSPLIAITLLALLVLFFNITNNNILTRHDLKK